MFSAMQRPTLFNTIPAIETLHAAWMSRADKYKYLPFQDTLNAATAKLNKYYKKTAESDAHILAMCVSTHLICPPNDNFLGIITPGTEGWPL